MSELRLSPYRAALLCACVDLALEDVREARELFVVGSDSDLEAMRHEAELAGLLRELEVLVVAGKCRSSVLPHFPVRSLD